MSNIPEDLSYTKEHEWVAGLDDGLTVTVGHHRLRRRGAG